MSSLITFLVGVAISLLTEKKVEHIERFLGIAGAGVVICLIATVLSIDGKTIYTTIIFNAGTLVAGFGATQLFLLSRKGVQLLEEAKDDVPPEPPKVEEPDYSVPIETRCSHQLILGSSGHGKTQLIAEQVAGDLSRPCSVVVFDSQGDLINRILKVDHPRVVLIDPTDIEYPPALGLFDFNAGGDTAYDKERNLNNVIELLSFVLNSLLDSKLTSKQDVCLRFAIRLCMVVESATIITLRDVFAGRFDHKPYLSKLSETARDFFETEFYSKQFQETREQILRRIYSILENQSLERMFKSPKTKLNMRELLDEGSVVLVNTAKSFLKEEGSKFFTRFIVALISQAIQERRPGAHNMPVFVYLDEASNVVDENVATLLETARKYRAGVILSFQSLGQIPHDLQHSIITNTAIKCLGGISAKDARALQDDVGVDAETLLRIPRLSFLFSVKNHFTRLHKVTLGVLELHPRRNKVKHLVEQNRAKYCVANDLRKNPPDIPGTNIDAFRSP
jgi:hypothetical protein